MGRQALGKMTEKVDLFSEFCAGNSLVISGTLFPHKPTDNV